MIRLSVFYPWSANAKFDMAYYVNTHMPLVQRLLGAACKGTSVDKGLGGMAPGSPPSFVAIGYVLAESIEALQATLAPNAAEIMGDIPNFTTIQPTLQVNEVKL